MGDASEELVNPKHQDICTTGTFVVHISPLTRVNRTGSTLPNHYLSSCGLECREDELILLKLSTLSGARLNRKDAHESDYRCYLSEENTPCKITWKNEKYRNSANWMLFLVLDVISSNLLENFWIKLKNLYFKFYKIMQFILF